VKVGVKRWGAIVDLTVEFEEACIDQCKPGGYLLVRCWDGVPPTPDELEMAAVHCARAHRAGENLLIHCAHGRGRSTTCMCAAAVRAGLFATWQEAFEAIKVGRPVVKLNAKMRGALAAWQEKYCKKTG